MSLCAQNRHGALGCWGKHMQRDTLFTNKIIHLFNHAADKHQLSPLEYMVWHALIYTCSNANEEGNQLMTASIADIEREVRIKRETIRRALITLKERGLAKQLSNRWVFQTVEQ